MTVDGDLIAALDNRLHAARRELRIAYDRRDAWVVEIDQIYRAGGLPALPRLFIDLHAAELAMCEANSARTESATTPSATDPGAGA